MMRPATITAWLVVLVTLGAANKVQGKDLFVDNLRGDDGRDGTSSIAGGVYGGPVRSLARALQLATAGDRILLANNPEPYRESVTIFGGRNGSLGSQPFVIEGNGATLEGSLPVPAKAWEHWRDDVFRFRPPHSASAIVPERSSRRATLSRCREWPSAAIGTAQWCLADGWIYFRVDAGKLPDEYPLSFAALPVGITLYEVRGAVIRDLSVQGFQLDGINAQDCAARLPARAGNVARQWPRGICHRWSVQRGAGGMFRQRQWHGPGPHVRAFAHRSGGYRTGRSQRARPAAPWGEGHYRRTAPARVANGQTGDAQGSLIRTRATGRGASQ